MIYHRCFVSQEILKIDNIQLTVIYNVCSYNDIINKRSKVKTTKRYNQEMLFYLITLTFAKEDWNVIGSELTVALDSDEEWGATATRGQLAREVNTFEEERERALQLRNDQLDQVLECEVVALRLVLVVKVLDELDGDFGVGLGLKVVAFVDLK
jgi:hypothetical protein